MTEVRDQGSEISGLVGGNRIENRESEIKNRAPRTVDRQSALHISLLTGGGDKPYALGMAAALTSEGISVDFIGSDDLNVPEVVTNPRINFLNLRGNQRSEASSMAKALRVLKYYVRLIGYSVTAKPKLF